VRASVRTIPAAYLVLLCVGLATAQPSRSHLLSVL
jgi:hypothetical protein